MHKTLLRLLSARSTKRLSKSRGRNKHNHYGQTLVLEEILTLSGLVDVDETQDGTDLSEATIQIGQDAESLNSFAALVNEGLDSSVSEFESGVFQITDPNGNVGFEWLYDGGKYRGEMGVFSLEGMDEYDPGSKAFTEIAAQRVVSGSDLGHIIFSDKIEGAKFYKALPNDGNWNAGTYEGFKTFKMTPGDQFGIMLIPDGTFQDVIDNPEVGEAKRPLYSMATANPDDHFHVGQLADVTGDGKTFVFEDWRADAGTDNDYNDLIFRIEGAEGEAVNLDEVIDPELEWRDSIVGQEIINYAESFVETDPIIVLAPEGITQIDLEPLFPELPEAEEWTFEVLDSGTQDLNPQIDGETLTAETQPEVEIERIAVQATNSEGEVYIQRPILIANGPAPETMEVLTDLLVEFEDTFQALSEIENPLDFPDLEPVQRLISLVEQFDELLEAQPTILEFLVQPQTLVALDVDESTVDTVYQLIHSDEVGQLLGLPNSLHRGLTSADPVPWDQVLIEATDLPSIPAVGGILPLVGFIDFTRRGHDKNTIGIFQSVDGLRDADYSLFRADNGNWAEKLTKFVDQVKTSDVPGAVVNLSFDLTQIDDEGRVTTRYELTPEEQVALQYAQDNNVLLVVSAGNTGDRMSALGAAAEQFDNMLVVGAVNRWEEKADYSAQGSTLSLVAPGGEWESDPDAFVGTSKAAAYVTAGATLSWAANPDLNYQQIKRIILDTADDLAQPGWDAQTGAGLLDIEEAIEVAQNTRGKQLGQEEALSNVKPFSGEGRVTPFARPNSSGAVQAALESLESSQNQILDNWEKLRNLGASDLTIEELAEELQARTEVTLDIYQELRTQAAITSAAEAQKLEEYELLNARKAQKSSQIDQLTQQLSQLEARKAGFLQELASIPEDPDAGSQQQFEEIDARINAIIEEAKNPTTLVSYEENFIDGHTTAYDPISVTPIERTTTEEIDFTKTTTYKKAEDSEIEALELTKELTEDLYLLIERRDDFNFDKALFAVDLLDGQITELSTVIGERQDELDELDSELTDIEPVLERFDEQQRASVEEIQDFLNVLGLALPTQQLKKQFQVVNDRIQDRLDGSDANIDGTAELQEILATNQAKIAVLDNTQLQTLIQNSDFGKLIETVSAEELETIANLVESGLNNDISAISGLSENGQALNILLSGFTDDQNQLLDILEILSRAKDGEENYDFVRQISQTLEKIYESKPETFLENIQTEPLVEKPVLDILSELTDRQGLVVLLDQLNELILEEIQLSAEEVNYHEQAAAVEPNVWYTVGNETFYNASQAELLRTYQQSASEIAHLRNLNWQARKDLLAKIVDFDVNLFGQTIDTLGNPAQQEQLAAEITSQESLIEKLKADLSDAETEEYGTIVSEQDTADQQLSATVQESVPSLKSFAELGTIASIYDVDFFETNVEPRIFDLQFSLQLQQQELEENLAIAQQVLEVVTENTASTEEIEVLKNQAKALRQEALQYLVVAPNSLVSSSSVEDPSAQYQRLIDTADTLEKEATLLENTLNLRESLPLYIETLESSKVINETAIAELGASLSQAGVALGILRQKQALEFQKQVERNQEILELVETQAQAEEGIATGTVLSYAEVQDQLREEIRKSILNWSDALELENSISQGLANDQTNYAQKLDSLIASLDDNLSDPHGEYQTALQGYEIELATLGAYIDAETQAQAIIDKLKYDTQLQKFELEQRTPGFWKDIAFVVESYGLDIVEEYAEQYGLEVSEIAQFKELQSEFIQHPEVLTTLEELQLQQNQRISVLVSEFVTWQARRIPLLLSSSLDDFFYEGSESGRELKVLLESQGELNGIIAAIREQLAAGTDETNESEKSEEEPLNSFTENFLNQAEQFSSSYVNGLRQQISISQYANNDLLARIYELSKNFALPLGKVDTLNNLSTQVERNISKISEKLNPQPGENSRVTAVQKWNDAVGNYRDAHLNNEFFKISIEDSKKQFYEKLNSTFWNAITSRDIDEAFIERNTELSGNIFYPYSLSGPFDDIALVKFSSLPLYDPYSDLNEPLVHLNVTGARYGAGGRYFWRFKLVEKYIEPFEGIRVYVGDIEEEYTDDSLTFADGYLNNYQSSIQEYESNLSSYKSKAKIEATWKAELERLAGKGFDSTDEDYFTQKAIGQAEATLAAIELELKALLEERRLGPEKQENLERTELDLQTKLSEFITLQGNVNSGEIDLDNAWRDYRADSNSYLDALQESILERGGVDREGLHINKNLLELEQLLESRLATLSVAVTNGKTLVDLLNQELQKIDQQIANPPVDVDLDTLKTRQTQLQDNLLLAEHYYQALTAQQGALIQKRNLAAAYNKALELSEKLIDAYLKSPDPDAESLKNQLLDIRASLTEAERLAEEAEERSQAFKLSLEAWEATLIANQDEVLQQAQEQQRILRELVTGVESQVGLVEEATEAYKELNTILARIVDLLKKAGEAGNRQADALRNVAFENRRSVIAEVQGTDYRDLSDNERKELEDLAREYEELAIIYEGNQQRSQSESDNARFSRLSAEATLNPVILIRNPYQPEFETVESEIYSVLEAEPKPLIYPADFQSQAALIQRYASSLSEEIEQREVFKKVLQYRKTDAETNRFSSISAIIERALRDRWKELSDAKVISLPVEGFVDQNLKRYEVLFEDEDVLYFPPILNRINQRLQVVEDELQRVFPDKQNALQEYRDWINSQLQITELEKEQIQALLGLNGEAIESNDGLFAQSEAAQTQVDDLQERINENADYIEQLKEDLRLAEVRRAGLEEILNQTQQTYANLISWEWVYIAQAQLEKTLAEESQEELDIAIEEWIEREALAIDVQRAETAAQIAALKQQQAEYDWQTTLNLARGELGLADLNTVIPPSQSKMAELLAQLKALETEQADLPDEVKALLKEVQTELNAALQGEEASNLSDKLIETINRFGELVSGHQAAIEAIDKELVVDYQRLDNLETQLQSVVKDLDDEAKISQGLRDEIDEMNAELRAVWDRIAAATEDVVLSEIEAQNLREWIKNVIDQRIKEREARRRARWFKAFGIIAMIIAVAATIVTLGGGSALVAGVLGLVAAGIQATMAGINKDWFGLATSVIQAVLNFIPALGTVLNSAGKPLVAASVASSLKNYGGALVSALQSGKAFASGDELLGILEVFAVFSDLATEGLAQGIKNGTTELTKNTQRVMEDIFNVIKEVPKKLYQGVQGIKSGDILSAINSFFNAVITLGSKITGHVSNTLADVTDWLGKAGNTALIVANFVENGGIFPLDQLLNLFADDLKELVEEYEEGELLDEAKKIAEVVEELSPEDRVEYLSKRLKDVPDELAAQVIDNLDSTQEQIDVLKNLPTEKQSEVFHGLSTETQQEWTKKVLVNRMKEIAGFVSGDNCPPEYCIGSQERYAWKNLLTKKERIEALKRVGIRQNKGDEFIIGVLLGEFNRNPSFGQILVGAALEMTPYVGFVTGSRDALALGLRVYQNPEEIKNPWTWVGFGGAIASVIPGIPGSSVKRLAEGLELTSLRRTIQQLGDDVADTLIEGSNFLKEGDKSIQFRKSGGFDKAQRDFDALISNVDPNNIKPLANGGRRAVLPDGTSMSVRPAAKNTPSTIQVDPPKGLGDKHYKIRYE